jgi:hypothetical protein
MDRNDSTIGYMVNCDDISLALKEAKRVYGVQASHLLPIKPLNINKTYKNYAGSYTKIKYLTVALERQP